MNRLTITVSAMAGSDIHDTCRRAKTLAEKTDCHIEFNFNGVTCIMTPGGDPLSLAEDFRNKINSDSKYKLAIS